jgi:hypothetical protein
VIKRIISTRLGQCVRSRAWCLRGWRSALGTRGTSKFTFDQILEPRSLLPRRRRAIYCPSISPLPDREPFQTHPQAESSNWRFSPTMFFLYNLERQVTLHPSYFGRNMHELVTGKLLKDVEGTCTGRYFIITIMDTFNISEGRILPGSGLAEFTVGYRAVVWRPFKGETVRLGLRS